MSDAGALDLAAVDRFMQRAVAGYEGPLSAEKFSGGQSNPTFLLTTPSRRFVLRRKPAGTLLKSAHAVEREFRVQKALADTDVPVPEMLALCEDEDVIGSVFFVMSHVEGRNFDDPRMPGLDPDARGLIVAEMARVLGAIHRVNIQDVGLGDFGRPGNYFARQVNRWSKQYAASETEPLTDMDALITWLKANVPADDGRACLVHGDYRIDNLLFVPDGSTCAAVLDWELSTIGHPLADLAAVLMQWRLPTGDRGRGLAGVDRGHLGLPSDDAFVDAYCASAGIGDVEGLPFALAFAFFRMAAILQGVKRRGLEGNASNPARAAELGTMVPVYAREGLQAAREAEGSISLDR
ncbi:MAG: phosphotransferase family protein [Pseudomonadota bacterium]